VAERLDIGAVRDVIAEIVAHAERCRNCVAQNGVRWVREGTRTMGATNDGHMDGNDAEAIRQPETG
jgi:hypothetical protein